MSNPLPSPKPEVVMQWRVVYDPNWSGSQEHAYEACRHALLRQVAGTLKNDQWYNLRLHTSDNLYNPDSNYDARREVLMSAEVYCVQERVREVEFTDYSTLPAKVLVPTAMAEIRNRVARATRRTARRLFGKRG